MTALFTRNAVPADHRCGWQPQSVSPQAANNVVAAGIAQTSRLRRLFEPQTTADPWWAYLLFVVAGALLVLGWVVTP